VPLRFKLASREWPPWTSECVRHGDLGEGTRMANELDGRPKSLRKRALKPVVYNHPYPARQRLLFRFAPTRTIRLNRQITFASESG
jgi:hypothetical protein